MGSSAVKGLCGKNFGYFPDTVDSPINSDDEAEVDSEAERYMPKGYKQAMREERATRKWGRLKMKRNNDLAQMGRGWGPFTVQVEVNGVRLPGIRANKARISGQMLEKLKAIGSLHTLELVHCHLKELPPIHHIDDLVVLQLSENSIRQICMGDNESAIKASKLEKFICDRNQVEGIQPGIFSGSMVSSLMAINLAHNNIAFLPRDFGHGAKQLLFLDLSYNRLESLPPDLPQSCKRLQGFYAQKNELHCLPPDIGALKDLRKLFLSHNKLRDVPDSVGDCIKLEKVRLISNEIRFLPASFINLWKQKNKGGSLDELLVDGNPLVQPSITAFEMGGLDQAMKLFDEWLQEQQYQEGEDALLALPPIAEEGRAAPVSQTTLPDAAFEAEHGSPQAPVIEVRLPPEGAGVGLPPEALEQEEGRRLDEGQAYYFGHFNAGSNELADIRNAESKLLLRKKGMYIEHQQKVGRDMQRKGKMVPAHLQKFMVKPEPGQPTIVESYTGKIPVTDLDLYFNLLVFSTRPMFSNCKALFDKFHIEAPTNPKDKAEPVMSQQEWNNLCNRVPVKLPAEVKDEMWKLLSDKHVIRFNNFAAGWHIHDIEHQDPFIQRVAKVQNLDYYDMDVEEMQERLKARGATEASLTLDFEGAEDDSPDAKRKAVLEILPPSLEGERRQVRRPEGGLGGSQAKVVDRGKPQISMTTTQFVESEKAPGLDGGADNEEEEGNAMDSDALSRDEDSELSAFDAMEILKDTQASRRVEIAEVEERCDDTYLMEAVPMTPMATPMTRPRAPKAKATSAARKKKDSGPATGAKDARFRTDVFQVRVALREAFRNMPFEDFRKLVNFLIRGMKRIEDFTNQVTYWHVDDPSFRCATGLGSMHNYAQKLLKAIGFVSVAETYWVWPEKHLSMGFDWAQEEVPPECPGLSPYRLDDMVRLLKACQKMLSTEGKNFRGHFH